MSRLPQIDPPRAWTRAEVLAWCQAHHKPAHLFLAPEPPPNPASADPCPIDLASGAAR